MAHLLPLPGYALVKLDRGKYKNIVAQAKVYESASSGTLVNFLPLTEQEGYYQGYEDALGKTVYWQELNAVAPISIGEDNYAYVRVWDLQGYDSE